MQKILSYEAQTQITERDRPFREMATALRNKGEFKIRELRDAYWENHKEEKERLLSEKHNFNQKIESLKSETKDNISILEKQINCQPEQKQIEELNQNIDSINEQIDSLSIFKSKIKKELRTQRDSLLQQKTEIDQQYANAIEPLKKRINDLQEQCDNQCNYYVNRITEIDTELIQPR